MTQLTNTNPTTHSSTSTSDRVNDTSSSDGSDTVQELSKLYRAGLGGDYGDAVQQKFTEHSQACLSSVARAKKLDDIVSDDRNGMQKFHISCPSHDEIKKAEKNVKDALQTYEKSQNNDDWKKFITAKNHLDALLNREVQAENEYHKSLQDLSDRLNGISPQPQGILPHPPQPPPAGSSQQGQLTPPSSGGAPLGNAYSTPSSGDNLSSYGYHDPIPDYSSAIHSQSFTGKALPDMGVQSSTDVKLPPTTTPTTPTNQPASQGMNNMFSGMGGASKGSGGASKGFISELDGDDETQSKFLDVDTGDNFI